ncbi:MAG: hypothetical protein PVSMB1_10770 [Gemmatimonadaceae bacterium]
MIRAFCSGFSFAKTDTPRVHLRADREDFLHRALADEHLLARPVGNDDGHPTPQKIEGDLIDFVGVPQDAQPVPHFGVLQDSTVRAGS